MHKIEVGMGFGRPLRIYADFCVHVGGIQTRHGRKVYVVVEQ